MAMMNKNGHNYHILYSKVIFPILWLQHNCVLCKITRAVIGAQ